MAFGKIGETLPFCTSSNADQKLPLSQVNPTSRFRSGKAQSSIIVPMILSRFQRYPGSTTWT